MPPNLEEFIQGEHPPDIIDVYDNSHFKTYQYLDSHDTPSNLCDGIVPSRCPYCNGLIQSIMDADCEYYSGMVIRWCEKVITDQLDLRCSKILGSGHHSKVILTPLTFPSTGAAPSVCGAVAVKLSVPARDASERGQYPIYFQL